MPTASKPAPLSERSLEENAQGASSSAGSAEITPDLVDKLADRVMSMLMQDLMVEKERSARSPVRRPYGL